MNRGPCIVWAHADAPLIDHIIKDGCMLFGTPPSLLVSGGGPRTGQVAFPLAEGHGTAKSTQVWPGSRHHREGFFRRLSNKSRNGHAINQPESLERKPGLATPWQESASELISSSGIFYALDIKVPRGCQLTGPPDPSHASGICPLVDLLGPFLRHSKCYLRFTSFDVSLVDDVQMSAHAKYAGVRDRSTAAHVAHMCW